MDNSNEKFEEKFEEMKQFSEQFGDVLPQAKLVGTIAKFGDTLQKATEKVLFDWQKTKQLENMLNQFDKIMNDFLEE